jgi:hypothetical protein
MASNGCPNGCVWQQFLSTPLHIKTSNIECDCELTKCKNYDICKNREMDEMLSIFGGFCMICEQRFGTCKYINLQKTEEEKRCRSCDKDKFLYKLPSCIHECCGDCIRDMFFIDYGKIEDYPEIPKFPYPPIGNEDDDDYFDPEVEFNSDDEIWKNDKAIKEWKRKWKKVEKYATSKTGKRTECPFCEDEKRKKFYEKFMKTSK